MKDTQILVIAISLLVGLIYAPASAQNEIVLPVDEYSPENPATEPSNGDPKWDLLRLKSDRLTKYTLATDTAGKKSYQGGSGECRIGTGIRYSDRSKKISGD